VAFRCLRQEWCTQEIEDPHRGQAVPPAADDWQETEAAAGGPTCLVSHRHRSGVADQIPFAIW